MPTSCIVCRVHAFREAESYVKLKSQAQSPEHTQQSKNFVDHVHAADCSIVVITQSKIYINWKGRRRATSAPQNNNIMIISIVDC